MKSRRPTGEAWLIAIHVCETIGIVSVQHAVIVTFPNMSGVRPFGVQ